MSDSSEPQPAADDMYPLVQEALRELNNGKGAKLKAILCYIRDNHPIDLEDGDLKCAVKGALKEGMCRKDITKSLLGKYKLTLGCKVKCVPPKKPSPKCSTSTKPSTSTKCSSSTKPSTKPC